MQKIVENGATPSHAGQNRTEHFQKTSSLHYTLGQDDCASYIVDEHPASFNYHAHDDDWDIRFHLHHAGRSWRITYTMDICLLVLYFTPSSGVVWRRRNEVR